MQTVNLVQGSAEWHAHRAKHFNASDAPAMMGESPYMKRGELVKRLATGITPDVDAGTQRLFDKGHQFEKWARPLAEKLVGEELFPSTGTEGKFSASFDGLTMAEDTAFEHKMLNATLRTAMHEGCTGADLPLTYQIQMEHQALVSGCDRILFMASDWNSDGTIVEERHCWYVPNGFLRTQIVAGWEQLEKDVAAYTPTAEAVVLPTAKVRDALPVLRIEARGEITASNLEDFKAVVLERINSVNTELTTDQEFADADADGKWLRDVAGKMAQAIQMVRSNIQPVDAVLVVLEQLQDIATKKAIAVEKLVKTEKDVRKEKIVTDAQYELAVHIDAINKQMGAAYLQTHQGIFAPVIKGLKSISSMQDKVRAALAQAIGDANATALRLRTNRDHLEHEDGSWMTLFPDFSVVGTKTTEDFQALAAYRIGQHKAAEEQRQEAKDRAAADEAERANREAAIAGQATQTPKPAGDLFGGGFRSRTAAPAPAAAASCCESRTVDGVCMDCGTINESKVRDIAPATTSAETVQLLDETAFKDLIASGGTYNVGDVNAQIGIFKVDANTFAAVGTQAVKERGATHIAKANFRQFLDGLIAHLADVRDSHA